MNNFITVKKVTKSFRDYKLKDISFNVEQGCILGIIGRNGCGKTTLLRMMMGAYRFGNGDEGDIFVDHISIKDNPVEYKQNSAFVLNETPFELSRSSIENGLIYGKYFKTFDMKKYRKLLSEFNVPKSEPIRKISKGQQIKQQLAFALSYDAKVYFLDEPAGNLDVEFRETFYRYLRKLTEDGTKSVIYTSHLVEELEEFADFILWIQREDNIGKVRYFGSTDDLKDRYRMVECDEEIQKLIDEKYIVGSSKSEHHSEILIRYKADKMSEEIKKYCRYAELKEIMYYIEKNNKSSI